MEPGSSGKSSRNVLNQPQGVSEVENPKRMLKEENERIEEAKSEGASMASDDEEVEDNTRSLLNQVQEMALELTELRSMEARYKTKVEELQRSRDQNEKMEKRLFSMLKNNKALKANVFEKSQEIDALAKQLQKVKEELKFEKTYRVGIQKNKLKVEHEMVDVRHKMKLTDSQSEDVKKQLIRAKKDIANERAQRLLELHRSKTATEEREDMSVELTRMREIAMETVELERRFLEQIEPLHHAIDAGNHLAEYYAEREMQLDFARKLAEGQVKIEQSTQRKLLKEIQRLTEERNEALKTLGDVQRKFAVHAVTASTKALMVSAPPKLGNESTTSYSGGGNNSARNDDPLHASWDKHLGATRVLEDLGLVNLVSLRASVLQKHDSERPRYMSETTSSLLRNGAEFRSDASTVGQPQTMIPSVEEEREPMVRTEDCDVEAEGNKMLNCGVDSIPMEASPNQTLDAPPVVELSNVERANSSELIAPSEDADPGSRRSSSANRNSISSQPDVSSVGNDDNLSTSDQGSEFSSICNAVRNPGASYIGRGLGLRRNKAVPNPETVIGQGTAKQVVLQIRRKIQLQEAKKQQERIQARMQQEFEEDEDFSESESSDSGGSEGSSSEEST